MTAKIELTAVPTEFNAKPRHRVYYRASEIARRCPGVSGLTPTEQVENLEYIRECLLDSLTEIEGEIAERRTLLAMEEIIKTEVAPDPVDKPAAE
jgi:hypothetical protein